ncbi:MAG: 30S ribosomal protein S6 [Thermodesulfobacteriota bacterium]
MRRYETIFITLPDLPEEDQAALQEKIRSLISARKGEIINLEDWGIKKLGYEIRKNKNGRYYFLDYRATPDLVREIERNFRLNDRVLKYLTVKVQRPSKTSSPPIAKESPPATGMEAKNPEQPAEGDLT